MKDRLAVACAVCAAAGASAAGPTTRTRRHRRRMHASAFAERLARTEIFGSSLPVLRSRDDDDDASSSSSSDAARAPCASPSAAWLRGLLRDVSPDDERDFFDWHLHALPFAYKLFVAPDARASAGGGSSGDDDYGDGGYGEGEGEYFGLDGEYTAEIYAANDRARAFWSGSGVDDDIRVLSAHGHDLADRHDKLVPTLEVMFGNSYRNENAPFDGAAEHAAAIQELILRLPGGYDFPLLTFNAFATYESEKHDRPSIILGDGYFAYQRAAGLGSEGPEYALAHEHAHHLQEALGVHDDQDEDDEGEGNSDDSAGGNDDDRRKELMADAFSAYFLAHDDGGDMTGEKMANVHDVAYSVGDCEVGDDGHHGTPLERRCATVWGAGVGEEDDDDIDDDDIVDDAGEGGEGEVRTQLDLVELKERFDAWYERVDDLDDKCGHGGGGAGRRTRTPRGSGRVLLLAVVVPLGVAAFALIVALRLLGIRRHTSGRKVAIEYDDDDDPKVFRTNSNLEDQPRAGLTRRTSIKRVTSPDEDDDEAFLRGNSTASDHEGRPPMARRTSLRNKLGLERSDDAPRVFKTNSTANVHEERPLTARGLERSVSDVVHSSPRACRTNSCMDNQERQPRRTSMMSKIGLGRSTSNVGGDATHVFRTNSTVDVREEQPLTDVGRP